MFKKLFGELRRQRWGGGEEGEGVGGEGERGEKEVEEVMVVVAVVVPEEVGMDLFELRKGGSRGDKVGDVGPVAERRRRRGGDGGEGCRNKWLSHGKNAIQ